MTSNISTTGINVNYPVAGVANSSQGFRDNFSAISTQLDTAADEISALQADKASVNDNNDFNTNVLSNYLAKLDSVYGYQFSTSLGTGTTTLDWQNGSYQHAITSTTNGTRTLAFSNFGESGHQAKMTVEISLVATGSNRILFAQAVKIPDEYKISVDVDTGTGFVPGLITIVDGEITGIAVSDGGDGNYTTGAPSTDTVIISGGGAYTDATAEVTVDGSGTGNITGVTMLTNGAGYRQHILNELDVGKHVYEFSTRDAGSTIYLTNYKYYP